MIHSHTHNLFLAHANSGQFILELGDQLMDIGEKTQFQRSDIYYKENHNFAIQSVDVHGKNRAIQIDLSEESEQIFQADLLTDFGTVEHVSDLYNALLNCHNWTKTNGIMIHSNPKTGTFANHGVSFFTEKFWTELAKVCGYELILVDTKAPYSDENPDKEVMTVLRKLPDSVFPPRKVFNSKLSKHVFPD